MNRVTSKDGTKIAFDKVGSGPAIILINGAMSYRAFDPTLGQLAELLSKHFTVFNYDRRGRGESGDTKPFIKEREIEDVQALIKEAGDEAMLFGVSSGGAIALEAAAATPHVSRVVVYEVPFIVDDSRQPVPDYEEHSSKLVAEGKLDELLNVYIPEVFGMLEDDSDTESSQDTQHTPEQADEQPDPGMWEAIYAVLPTIPYDAAFVGEFMKGEPLSTDYWAKVTAHVLVADGSASAAWIRHAADALGNVLPDASRQTFEGQTHSFDPAVLAPTMIEFFKQ